MTLILFSSTPSSSGLPSLLSSLLIPAPTNLQPSLTSFSTFTPHHEPFTLSILTKASARHEQPRPTKRTVVCCKRLDLLENSHIEEVLIYSLFVGMGFGEKETGLLLGRNPALKMATFESVRARVLSLQSLLGLTGVESYGFIRKFPNLLTAEEINPFFDFVLNGLPGKIDPAQIKRVLSTAEPKSLVGFDQKVELLVQHGVSEEKIVHVLNSVNLTKALCLKSVEEIDRTIAFLSRIGGIDMIVRCPLILKFDLDTQLVPRVEFFKKLGGGNEDAAGAVLRKLPAILCYSAEHLESQAGLLRSCAGLSDMQVYEIFHIFPNLVSVSKERKLRPRIDFLKQCCLSSDEIFKFLRKAPLFLGLSFEDNLVHKLVFLIKIGYRHRTKELAAAVGAATRTSCENLQNVVGLFLSYGLSCADILAMSKKHPQTLQYSSCSLHKKMEYLIEGIGRDVGELLSFPAFLGYNLDYRIKHRYEVKKKIVGERMSGMSLNKLLSVSADKFSADEGEKFDSLVDNLNKG